MEVVKHRFIICYVLCFYCMTLIWAKQNGVEFEEKIKDKLSDSLPKHVPPLDLEDNCVRLYLDLHQILDVNEKEGQLTLKLWMYIYYFSPSAVWNSTEHGNYTSILLDAGTLWLPDVC